MDELRRVAGALVAGVLVGALFWPVSCITAVSAVVGMSSDGADSETRSEGAVPRAPDELQGLPQRSTSCWGLIVPLAHYTSASCFASQFVDHSRGEIPSHQRRRGSPSGGEGAWQQQTATRASAGGG